MADDSDNTDSNLSGADIRSRFRNATPTDSGGADTDPAALSGADIRQRFQAQGTVADASTAKPGDIDPITGKPYQFATSGTPGPVGQSTGGFIRDDMVPGAGTQAVISLAGDPEQKRRIAAAQLFPDKKPLDAQSRLFYGPNGRLAAINDDGTAYYVDPAKPGTATDPYSPASVATTVIPRNPLSYAGSGAGPAMPAAGATILSGGANPGAMPVLGAIGGAAGDLLRQNLAARFDPGSPNYDPKATLGAAVEGAGIGVTGTIGKALSEGGPAISGVPSLSPKGGPPGGAVTPPPEPLTVFPPGRNPPSPTPPEAAAPVTPSAVGPASRNPAITQDIPTTSEAAKTIAKPYYKMAETSGAGSTTQGTDAIIGLAEDKLPTGLVGEARGGAVPDFVKWVQEFKGKPLTYEDLSNIDKELGERISENYKFPGGLSEQGKDLFDIQTAIRQRLLNPQQGDLAGDASGYAAKRAGDQAWSQAKKMEDVERMWSKAQDTQNPDTSFANQWRNYKYSAKSRGWSDEEVAAADAAATSGREAPLMHILGSRLLTVGMTIGGTAAGHAAGAMFGPLGAYLGPALGGATAAVPAYIAGALARRATTGATGRGVENALSVLGRGTPPTALTPPP